MQETVSIKVAGNSYESKKITVGVIVNIDKIRSIATSGQYRNLSSAVAMDIADVVAFVEALFPKLSKDVSERSGSLMELSPKNFKEIESQVTKVVVPWYNLWIREMQKVTDDEES